MLTKLSSYVEGSDTIRHSDLRMSAHGQIRDVTTIGIMSVNRTAIVDIPPGPNVDEPGAATAAGRPYS